MVRNHYDNDNVTDVTKHLRSVNLNLSATVESLQKENEELRKQLTWIPVEDYLPKDRNDVLVKVKQNEKVVYKMDWYNQEINAWHRYSCAIEGFVIEWLPIPDINNK